MEHRSLPPWPAVPPSYGAVSLRRVCESDIGMARELSTDPYVPLIGSLPKNADDNEAGQWVLRQNARHSAGTGFSFTIVEAGTQAPVGHCGLWTRELPFGRCSAGYSMIPSARGRGYAADALVALTAFGWTIPELHRIELYIEPWNRGSIRTAERAGYRREGLLRSYSEINGRRRDMLMYASTQ